MKKITATNDGYYVIEENPTEPVFTIEEIEYGGRQFSQHNITGWGGSASRVEDEERCIDNMSRSIKYVKEHCHNRGNLG